MLDDKDVFGSAFVLVLIPRNLALKSGMPTLFNTDRPEYWLAKGGVLATTEDVINNEDGDA